MLPGQIGIISGSDLPSVFNPLQNYFQEMIYCKKPESISTGQDLSFLNFPAKSYGSLQAVRRFPLLKKY